MKSSEHPATIVHGITTAKIQWSAREKRSSFWILNSQLSQLF
ncbi:hypothetical protein [Burkholderia anthina]|nr:hypothetical protein [Burkholderia anthina]